MENLADKNVFITGGSRGIGLAIARRAAADGARVALMAKTTEPHPVLEGTIFTAAAEIERMGGKALPIAGDIRDDEAVEAAVERTVAEFGGLDVVVNNASAIDLSPPGKLPLGRYDLMQDINARGTYVVCKCAVPHLRRSPNPHVVTLSPPLDLDPRWFEDHLAYTISKYSMSMVTIGMAATHRQDGIAFNSLWPRTLIATAAVENVVGGADRARRPEIMADAAYLLVTQPSRQRTGELLLDEDLLREGGVTDFSRYEPAGSAEPELDIFVS